jgi:site-specific recombinase XerD
MSFKASKLGMEVHQRNCVIIFRVIQMLKALRDKLYFQGGYCLYVALFRLTENSPTTIQHLKASYAPSTWKGKIYGWNHFVDFLTEEERMYQYFDTPKGLEILVIHFLEWCIWENNETSEEIGKVILRDGIGLEEETNSSVIPEKDRNCPTSAVLLIKSAVCSLFHLAFYFDARNLPMIQQWIKSWKKKNIIKRKRFVNIWDAGLLLDYLRTVKIDLEEEVIFDEDYKILQDKTIALVAFFTILRSSELANLNKQSLIQHDDGALLSTKIKTVNDQLVNIFIPKVEDVRIYPWSHLNKLMEYNDINFTDNLNLIWRQPKGGSQLTTYHIRKILTDNLAKAGISFHFTSYSYKHAAISFLVRFGIPQQQIEQACRLKFHKNSSTISTYYAVSDSLKQIHKLFASATSRNMALEGLTRHREEIEPVVIGKDSLIEKRK